mgnify:CR=1 FL=1
MIDLADTKFSQSVTANTPREQTDDLKVELTRQQLSDLIGQQLCVKLEDFFAGQCNKIVVRRCQAHGKLINFHTDEAEKTLQLSLNDDSEYEGGRLLFVTKGKVEAPQRKRGTVTVHDNTIVHGVTRLKSGVRYGLFFLQNK